MNTTPEEFFVKGLMEQSPPSPPIFLDLPHMTNDRSEGRHHVSNDMMLPYISRVLLEDDEDDRLNNHPALLQVQQPFAQILSSPSCGTYSDNPEEASNLLRDGSPDGSTLNSAISNGTNVAQAFLKGMEEANMLLPKDSKFRGDEQLNQIVRENTNHSGINKRCNRDAHLEEEVRRTSKAVMTIKHPEENCANEILDELMFHAYEICIRNMNNKLHIMGDEVEKESRKNSSKVVTNNVVDIRILLISCAEAVAANNHMEAYELLKKIKKHASATGDATQRLAQCFTKGLEARLMGEGSQLWQLLMAEPPSVVEFLKAYRLYFVACCFNEVALIFSTMTILPAMVGKRKLHIVDYGMHFGFQWAGLLRLLASREGGLPEVKITAIGPPKTKSCPVKHIEEIGCRLSKCAHAVGLPSFKFHTIMRKWEDVSTEDLNIDTDEVLVVNDLFNFSTLMDDSGFFGDPSPRDTVLNNIKKMRPYVFIQSILNRSCGSSFLPRFRELLFYYMALFDILDATMTRESESRLALEQFMLGRSAVNAIACEGMDLVDRPEKYKQWQARNQRVGLRQLPLKSSVVELVKDKVMKHHHKDFFISEDGRWLLQGWMGRVLFAHTTWVAGDPSLDKS
ncbi:unnamed protein product [Urochloa decumbens]|uniref:Uncharacterized protein n=1 Tax=Urochloa decumbens TaxID=240449 RepID=A0ABC9AM47_9POAL